MIWLIPTEISEIVMVDTYSDIRDSDDTLIMLRGLVIVIVEIQG